MRQQADQWLQEILGQDAAFRDGQWSAIDALVNQQQRVLVVQRTGWGKSLVYFMATRLQRAQNQGVTLLISPLLSLMRNQIQSAQAWGLRAYTLNSANSADHDFVEQKLLANEVDLLLVSPERLANDRFRETLWHRIKEQIGLLVIDEAHCISDWGHDFRPNYRRIMRILEEIPANTPVLGTTATANDRVVEDVAEILGASMNIQRGALTRDSLALYVYPEKMDTPTRFTLLSHLLKHLNGSGIIYCTTTRDCRQVAEWLQSDGFNVKPYYANVEKDLSETREDLENQLMNNQVKALVSSVALGMGFDKADLHFVIHYQMPGNIISYYQQIGRAGRGIDKAHIVLMHGSEDEDIQEFFIETAFPSPKQVTQVVEALRYHGAMIQSDLQKYVNAKKSVLEKILVHLEVESIITKDNREYHIVDADKNPDFERWSQVTQKRYEELRQMKAYIHSDTCLMHFLADALDDPTTLEKCGRCRNCTGATSKFEPDIQHIEKANRFLRGNKALEFAPRKRFPKDFPNVKNSVIREINQTGTALCDYYDDGWGRLVREGRKSNHYADELVIAAGDVIQQTWQNWDQRPTVVTAVPSLRRPNLVPDFAQRLAQIINLPYYALIEHVDQHPPQSDMHNSFQQATNLIDRFAILHQLSGKPILLVDDFADSQWTLTLVGRLLMQQGSGAIYPFALGVMNL
ncbi:MAG: RecQ family ATP-dependent DNA helicase [Phototrophicaceae bacterium]